MVYRPSGGGGRRLEYLQLEGDTTKEYQVPGINEGGRQQIGERPDGLREGLGLGRRVCM